MIIRLMDLILEDSTSDQAKGLGLDYLHFGRWGKNGKVTHITQNDKLVPYTPTTQTPSQQDSQPKQSSTQTSTPTTQPSTEKPTILISVDGETDGGSASYEEFSSQFPEFTDEQEDSAQQDADAGYNSVDWKDKELNDTIKNWKWGGDEGVGVWSFDEKERSSVFDRLSQHILDSGVTVSAPTLHRGIAFDSTESANRFIGQLGVGKSVELPPSGWAPNSEVALGYGPDSPDSPEVSMMVELQAGDSPIRGMALTRWEEEMGMDTQHEVITPGNTAYTVREIKKYTVSHNGKEQTVYKVVMTQNTDTNESITEKQKKYALLAYMGGNMAMAQNIRKYYIKKNK